MNESSPVFAPRIPADQMVVNPGQLFGCLKNRQASGDVLQGRLKLAKPPMRKPLPEKERKIGTGINLFTVLPPGGWLRRRGRSMRDSDLPAELVQHLVPCDLSVFVVEDPADHARVHGERQWRNRASDHSQTIKLLQPCITSLLLGADDAYKILSVVIEHGHIGP